MAEAARPTPEALLATTQREGRGKLKIFLGASPGVGKTFAMLEAARNYSDRLATGSFPADFLDKFGAAIDAVRDSLGNRKGRSTAKSGATKSIAALLKQGRAAVAALDGLVTHQILGDARLEREWAVSKRIRRANAPVTITPAAPTALTVQSTPTRVPAPITATPEVLKAAA